MKKFDNFMEQMAGAEVGQLNLTRFHVKSLVRELMKFEREVVSEDLEMAEIRQRAVEEAANALVMKTKMLLSKGA